MWKMEPVKLPMLAGFVYALAIVLIGALVTSSLLAFSGTKESSLPLYVYMVNGLALFVGGFVSGKRSGEKGWYYGGLTGLLYFLFMLLVSFLGFDAKMGMTQVYQLLMALACSAMGGIIGVNMSGKK
ncbi:TIGR04086 family membrane protein [Aneurinibacillus uraniidurans]|uniref:TIGR04086 family membrane protein n=1 Tax=Aneurinibacillus uraniidurans TaxID=2966586 RepID=UPI00234ADDCF|nr:TIGR04086 family membrane protein [Aneurinibacillus sp. B1]WCN38594.1 TIGR04086 family membrane protein [Aneurinibacillus sp. B1]